MATGSITSLGIGSGLDLQNILDKLREADNRVIDVKTAKKSEYQEQINAYNGVNARLYNIKSNALDLSLQSNFLNNSSTLTDESVLDAVVSDGLPKSFYSIDVTQKASRSAWEASGVESQTQVMFTEPDTGIADPDEAVTVAPETMSIFYGEAGSEQQIDVDLASGLSLSEISDAINNSVNNQDGSGEKLVNASLAINENSEYYIRLSAASGGDSADSEITVAGFDYVAADTTIGITQDSSTMYLSVAPGTSYLSFAGMVNSAADNPGVTADIIDNGDAANPYQLTLTADDTGEDARISLTNLTLTEVTGTGGESLNAIFSVNGIEYQRQANTAINDVISGVTLNLKNTGETTLNIESDLSGAKEDIMGLVSGFNSLISYINGENDEDSSAESSGTDEEEDNPLSGSNDVNRLVSRIKSLFTTIVDTGSAYTSLADLGMDIDREGVMTIDEAVLDQALASDPDAVADLFIGDAENDVTGLGDIINDGIGVMVASQGAVATRIDALETMMDRLDEDIENTTERLDKRYETMTAEFARLDSYIRQLNSESGYLQSMFDAFDQKDKK